MHPSDMILEQSNDDDDSYMDKRPRRGAAHLPDQENISLIEDDYIIVDPITEQYRAANKSFGLSKRSFFEESLIMKENSPQSGRDTSEKKD